MSGGKAPRLPPAIIFSYFTGGSKAHERMSATTCITRWSHQHRLPKVCPSALTPPALFWPRRPQTNRKISENFARNYRETSAKLPKYLPNLSFLLCVFNMLYFSKNLLTSASSIFQIGFPNRTGKPLNHIREFSAKPARN
jgi:hypothetical protein